jgi:succinate-semialdehyde dehydrogenase/glutarate-semialdehyde dehydrogenase
MPSADLEAAVKTAVTARCINNGQSCIAAKRFIVHERIHDEFERRMSARLAALKIGDPLKPEVDIGPLATPQGVDDVERQVNASVKAGARLVTGGKRLGGKGNFYPPTLLADIPPSAPAYREEVFGPVALLFRVRDLDQAIALANDSQFGLGSAAWTNDPAEQARFVDEIEAGATFINGMVASDPRLPFGGVKRSGHGRELALHGIREFVNAKTIVVAGAQKAAVDPGTHAAE